MAKASADKRASKTVEQPTATTMPAIEAAPATKRATSKAKAAAPSPARRPAKALPAPAPAVVADKTAKIHKPKLVRDSFTIPKDEYQVIDALKRRVLGLEHPVRKSELLRAGIRVLDAMNDKSLLKALAAVPTLKTGRPKAD